MVYTAAYTGASLFFAERGAAHLVDIPLKTMATFSGVTSLDT